MLARYYVRAITVYTILRQSRPSSVQRKRVQRCHKTLLYFLIYWSLIVSNKLCIGIVGKHSGNTVCGQLLLYKYAKVELFRGMHCLLYTYSPLK